MDKKMTWTRPGTHHLDTSGSGVARVGVCLAIYSTNWRVYIWTTGTFSLTLYLGPAADIWTVWHLDKRRLTYVAICLAIHSANRAVDCDAARTS